MAQWCGHCKRLTPAWNELAVEAKGLFSVAKVDATEHTYTAKRFDVRGFPTIKLLHQGKMYSYEGPRTVKDLREFALGGFEKQAGVPIPGEPTWSQVVWDQLQLAGTDIKRLIGSKPEACGAIFAFGQSFCPQSDV